MSDTRIETLRPLQEISFEEFLSDADPIRVRRETFLVPIEKIVLAENIRPFDYPFIEILKESIKEQGQLQECIGDVVMDENGEYLVRVVAGQHREKAIEMINAEGIPMFVRVSVADRTLDPEAIIGIQMSENLQNKMTSAQDAFIIHNFWRRLKEIRESNGGSITKLELARKVGRSPETVSNSIKYIEDVNPIVQQLVDKRSLSYSLALLLSSIEKGNGYESKQVSLAMLFIAKSYTLAQAEKHIRQLNAENGFAGPLFGGDEWEIMEIKNHMLAIRDEADREGRLAAGWFVRMVHAAKVVGGEQQVKVSEAIKNAVKDLDMSLEEFENSIKPFLSSKEFNEIFKGNTGVSY